MSRPVRGDRADASPRDGPLLPATAGRSAASAGSGIIDEMTAGAPVRPGGSTLLVAGGVLSGLNGATHFLLPVIYPWAEHVEGLYEPVRWALYATTVFFGVLLVLGGLLTVAVARSAEAPLSFVRLVAGGMAVFWGIGAGYEVIVPFPWPGVSWVLPTFSVLVALLYLLGLRRRIAWEGQHGG